MVEPSPSDGSYTLRWTKYDTSNEGWNFRVTEVFEGETTEQTFSKNARSHSYQKYQNGTYSYQIEQNIDVSGEGTTFQWFTVGSIDVTVTIPKPGTMNVITVPTGTVASGEYDVSWGAGSGYTDYFEYREEKNGSWGAWKNKEKDNSEPFSNQEDGLYRYQARSCNDSGCGGAKTSGYFNVLKRPTTPATITVPPGYNSSGEYTVSWAQSGETVDRYELRESVNGNWGAWQSEGTVLFKEVNSQDEAVYRYEVKACNATGCSGSAQSADVEVLYKPTPVTGLVSNVSQTTARFTLQWSAASGTIAHYKIEENFAGEGWGNPLTVDSSKTSEVLDVSGVGSYQYRISACNASGCGGVSNAVTVVASTVIVEPTPSDGSYTLTWANYDADNGVSYRVTETFGSTVFEESFNKYTQSKAYEKTKNGTYHYVIEQQVDVSGDGSQLQWFTVGTVSVDVLLPQPGTVPLSVSSAHNWVNDQVVVSYTPLSSVHVDTYELEFSSGGSWNPLIEGDLTLNDKGVYNFRVRAVNDSGPGPWSEARTETYDKPLPPELYADHIGEDGEVDLRWVESGGDADYFTLVSPTDPNFSDPGELTGNSYTVPNVSAGRQEYRIAACLSAMEYCSEFSGGQTSHSLSSSASVQNISGLAAPTEDLSFTLPVDESVIIWEGDLSINGGAINYAFPIALPPGRKGVRPSLSASYSSQSGYGNLGFGWSISSGGSISRCQKIFAIDGESRPVNFDNSDALCLNGQRLILVSGSYGQSGAVYATETYDGSKVTQKGGAFSSSSAYFEVETKTNQLLVFGQSAGAVLTPTGAGSPLSWKQSKQEDSFGNNILWEYETAAGEHRLNKIYYTGYQGTAGSRVVDFVYESANRYRRQYLHGGETLSTSRLQKLVISINGTTGHEYRFNYLSDENIDRLESLSYCPASNSCTTNTINWGDTEGLIGSNVPAVDILAHSDDGLYTRAVGGRDFDGDGLFDVWARDQGIYLSSLQQWVVDPEINDLTSLANQFDESRIDINLDGRDDLLFTTSDKKLKYATWDSAAGKFAYVYTGIISLCDFAVAIPSHPSAVAKANFCESAASDIDGDGAIDVLMPYEKVSDFVYRYHLYKNVNGTLVSKAQFEAGAFGAISMRDIDGDGTKDVLINASQVRSDKLLHWYKVTVNGDAWSISAEKTIALSGLPGDPYMDGRGTIKWADVNGDGLQDLLSLGVPSGLEYEWYYALNRGDGTFTTFSQTGLPEFALFRTQATAGVGQTTSMGAFAWNHLAFAVDINHDGIEDLMAPSGIAYKASCENGSYQNNPCNIDTDLEGAPVQYDVYEWSAYIAKFDENGLQYTEKPLGIQSHQETLWQADVNGDGVMDYGSFLGANGLTYTYRGPTPGVYIYLGNRDHDDLVAGIELADERLERYRFHYAGLAEQHADGQRIYTPNAEPRAYPYTNFVNGMRVVKSVESDNGVGGFNEERYRYEGAVANLEGRGFAGFRRITREEMVTGNRDITNFLQTFPYGGMLESRQQYTGDDVLFFDYRVTGQNHNFGQPAGTFLPRVTADETKEYEITDSTLLSTVTTGAGFDALGNQISGTSVELDSYGETTKTTVAEFDTAGGCRSTPAYSEVRVQRDNFDIGAGVLSSSEQFVRTDYSDFESCAPKRTEQSALGGEHPKVAIVTFDQYGNVLSSTQQGGADADRVATNIFDPEGYFVEATYNNEWGNSVRSYQTTDPWFGTVVSAIDPNSREVSTSLNDFGQPLTATSDAAPTTHSRRTWCDAGCPQFAVRKAVSWSEGSAPVTAFMDSLDRVVRSETEGFDGRLVVSNKTYNARGHLTRTERPHYDGSTVAYETWSNFDDLGRAGEHQRYSNPLSFTTTYGYSGSGVSVSVVNGDGSSLSMFKAFAANKKLVYTQDAMGGKTYYRYDGAGRLVSLVDAATNDTTYEYNGFGELTAVDDPNAGRSSFSYNAFGERDVSTDGNNKVIDTFYDKLGRVTGTVSGTDATAKYYDQNGLYGLLTTEARNEDYIRLFDYKPGSLHPSATFTVIDGDKVFEEKTAWDNQYHRPTVTLAASGDIFRSRYNARGYEYQHQHYQSDQSWVSTWTLDNATANGAPVLQRFMGGIEQKINRYAGSDIIDDICAGGINCLQSDTVQSIGYRHNAWGSVVGEGHQHNGLDYAYTHDNLHRLDTQTVSSSSYPQFNRSVDYDYDAVGNLIEKSDYATALQYGNPTRTAGGNAGPHAVRQVTTLDGQSHNLVYDNAGNLITGINGLIVGYDNYNQANRIERNGIVTEYKYGTGIDAYKKTETEGTSSTTTLYIGNFEQISTSDGATNTRLTFGGYFVIAREGGATEQSVLLMDRLGSVTTIVDANKQPGETGFVRQFRSYDPFGQSRDFQGQDHLSSFTTTDQGFTGHRHLNDQKLIHMRGRVYDYQLGRFLSPDPIIQDPQNSQSLNAYSYIMNNPLAGTDPTGYASQGGDTGQVPDAAVEGTPFYTAEGQQAQRIQIKRGVVKQKIPGSRIERKGEQVALVDGNGNTLLSVTQFSGQKPIISAGEGWSNTSRAGSVINRNETTSVEESVNTLNSLPENSEEVFKEGQSLAEKQTWLEANGLLSFDPRHAFCPETCTINTIQYRSSKMEAIEFLNNNPDYGLLLGTEFAGSITVYPAATVSRNFSYPAGSRELYKAFALRRPKYTELTGAESVLAVIAHETGHRNNIDHGPKMKKREFEAIRRSRQ